MKTAAFPGAVRTALSNAWSPESATTSMERWLDVCSREGWKDCPHNLSLLTLLFGASWYFTRLVFFRGREVMHCFDGPPMTDYSTGALYRLLARNDQDADLDQRYDNLRLAKNELMLQIFLSQLQGLLTQEQLERALTSLAEASLQRAMELLWKEDEPYVHEIAVMGMGRMAGGEMNFGSDLDLVFLYSEKTGSDVSALLRQIRTLLRHIAVPAPAGILYEIDMRLRPHGTSGTLISPLRYFIEYHSGTREVWERQMMTRCRPVVDRQGLAAQALTSINPCLYAAHDPELLRAEILHMRKKVQYELGTPKDKYEIKRGSGGIMDIDFLTHFLQLRHGHEHPVIQTPSTRKALRALGKSGIIDNARSEDLLAAYDFMKKLEGALRVADMKNLSAFSNDANDRHNQRLGRAMGHLDENRKKAAVRFVDDYLRITRNVRWHFTAMVGEVGGSGSRGRGAEAKD